MKQRELSQEIEIDWDTIPVQVLLPKLEKALRCTIRGRVEEYDAWHVDSETEKGIYLTFLTSCECDDWVNAGTSINPCKHMIRVKYSDEEIKNKLLVLGADAKTIATIGQQSVRQKAIIPIKTFPINTRSVVGGDTLDTMIPVLPEIGKIKIGEKAKGIISKGPKKGQEYMGPKKLDHFKIATLEKDENGCLILDNEMNALITAGLKEGEKCKELDIMLCYDNPWLNFQVFYAYFTASRLVCIRQIDNGPPKARWTNEDGTRSEKDCDPKTCEHYKSGKCRDYARLSVILLASNRVGGAYFFRTRSGYTIRYIKSSMRFIRVHSGVLAGIPLKMRILPMTVQPRDLGRNTRIYVVTIEYKGTLADLSNAGMDEIRRRYALGIDYARAEQLLRDEIEERAIREAEEEAEEIEEEWNGRDEDE